MSIPATTKAIWIALAVAVLFLWGLVDNAYKAGLREGREQACARLQNERNADMCAQLIGKDVAIDERVNEEMERK